MKPKATLVILNHEIYQNYFLTGLINTFTESFDLSIIYEESLHNLVVNFIEDDNIKYLAYKRDSLLSSVFLGCSLSKTKQKSSLCRSFALRLRRIHPSFLYLRSYGIYQTLRTLIKDIFLIVISSYFSKKNFRKLTSRIKNTSLIKNIQLFNPKYVFVPCQAVSYEIFYTSLAREKSMLNISDICLIDNWDNLSSKSIFLKKPNFIGVYGEQAKNHCDRIQGLKEESIFKWGSPRYDLYLKNLNKEKNLSSHNQYILYAGTSIYYDEFEDIKKIANYLKKSIDIKYFPHPYRTISRQFRRKVSKQVFTKNNIEKINRNGDRDLNQIVDLIRDSKFVICGPTSIILEALICEKKVLVSSRSDLDSYQATSEIFFGYEHFDGIELNPLVKVISEVSSIETALNWANKKPTQEEKLKSKNLLNYYIELKLNRKDLLTSKFT